MQYPDSAVRQWLMCPALDADPSWRSPLARRGGRASSLLRIVSAELLRAAPRPLLQPPLPMAWVRWMMQPRDALVQRLKVLTGVMLQPVVRRQIQGEVRRTLVAALGVAGYHEAVSHPMEAALAEQLSLLDVAEPDWHDENASLAPGLMLAEAQLSTLDPYLGWRLRLKFAAQGDLVRQEAAGDAWASALLQPLVEQILLSEAA